MDKIISLVLPCLLSAVVSLITINISHKPEIKKSLHSKRYELYVEFYSLVETIIRDTELVFDDNFWDRVDSYKPKMKLLSSKNTFRVFRNFYSHFRKIQQLYNVFCQENDPHLDDSRRETIYDEYTGEELREDFHINEHEIYAFENQSSCYKQEHKPTIQEINKFIVPLYEAMRKDLGNSIL